jgi:hypothetical protein
MGGAQLANNLSGLFDNGNDGSTSWGANRDFASISFPNYGDQSGGGGTNYGSNVDFTNIGFRNGNTTGLNAYNKPSYQKTGKVGS